MRKYLNKSIGLLLGFILILSIACIAVVNVNFDVFAQSQYSRVYTALTDAELDELSFRTATIKSKFINK